jgi:2OG-Fe(II) oxygenase superfamily
MRRSEATLRLEIEQPTGFLFNTLWCDKDRHDCDNCFLAGPSGWIKSRQSVSRQPTQIPKHPHQQNRPAGVRVLTCFMYLSDVDEGGNTSFPNMNITVVPKKGRAILWPSVLDEDPNAGDSRTDHEALPVVAGIKHWIHQRDYRTPNQNACD